MFDVFGASELRVDAEARVGAIVNGKWTITRLIGLGGVAAVYEAHHHNQSRVALKILHRWVELSPLRQARFLREGYAANRVGHPGVVRVFDEGVDEHGSPFLVMELLEGVTLAQHAAALGGKVAPVEVLDIADAILDVLSSAHERGILHRDLKPENLFLTNAGELKILDFGIARIKDRVLASGTTELGTLLGTPAFVAPEQARGALDELDPRTDLWALGATMFYLLTGEFVHLARTANEQLALAMLATPRSLRTADPQLPEALVQLVDRALAFSSSDRWSDARSMQLAVQALRRSWADVVSRPDSIPERLFTGTFARAASADGAVTVDEAGSVTDEASHSSRAIRPSFSVRQLSVQSRTILAGAALVSIVALPASSEELVQQAERAQPAQSASGPSSADEMPAITRNSSPSALRGAAGPLAQMNRDPPADPRIPLLKARQATRLVERKRDFVSHPTEPSFDSSRAQTMFTVEVEAPASEGTAKGTESSELSLESGVSSAWARNLLDRRD